MQPEDADALELASQARLRSDRLLENLQRAARQLAGAGSALTPQAAAVGDAALRNALDAAARTLAALRNGPATPEQPPAPPPQ